MTKARIGVVALAVVLTLGSAGGAFAADWHHMHLLAPDPGEAAAWYADVFGGEPQKFGPVDFVPYGKTLLMFMRGPEGFKGSDGSSVDHISFAVDDADAAVKAYEEKGIKVLAQPRAIGDIKFFFIEDPWGTKIEVIQDPGTSGFHHVHLHTPDPDATLAWYAKAFGGEVTKFKGFLPAIKYGDMWVLAQKSEAKEPTIGRAADHLGWSFPDLDAAAEKLKADGVTFTMDPRPFGTAKIAFIEGPDGVRIELVEAAQ